MAGGLAVTERIDLMEGQQVLVFDATTEAAI
jgi:hypothetical protein